MNDDLMKLIAVQDIDLEIDQFRKSRILYPAQIDALKREIDEVKHTLNECEHKLEENKINRSTIETEITAERELLVKRENRLLETKTNKEYTAVQHEIEMSRDKIDSLETDELQRMTEYDALVTQRDELKKTYDDILPKNTAMIEEKQKLYKSIEADIAVLEEKRHSIIVHIDNKILSIYNRLRKGENGLAVVTVDKKRLSCTGCFKQLPPQKVLEIRRVKKILYCENCGRILVWDTRDEKE